MSEKKRSRLLCSVFLFAGILLVSGGTVSAQSLSYLPTNEPSFPQYAPQNAAQDDQSGDVTADELPAQLQRQVVDYPSNEPAGTIIVDTPHTYLYLTLGGGKAMRYGIGVGREGFTWSGTQTIVRKAEWPDWIPPAEMVARQPYLPRWVGGGPGNPLGARAMYLGNTDYRIHGTNDPTTIGKHVSSGCIRLQNSDVIDLYQRVSLGAKVVVLPNNQGQAATDRGRRVAVEQSLGGTIAGASGPATTTQIAGTAQSRSPTRVY
ncbi:MAG: L,D-transpeptidase [Xanthobacteraceae bacterium]|jgi:lipoprotein-anchoring transpeptidase ErfK/SrfK